jgi:hypothetical protein
MWANKAAMRMGGLRKIAWALPNAQPWWSMYDM